MDNRQINRQIKAFSESRQRWIDILLKNPDSVQAAQYILSCNSKIEFLRVLWNWSDESVEQYEA
jgi:hypothetical protein